MKKRRAIVIVLAVAAVSAFGLSVRQLRPEASVCEDYICESDNDCQRVDGLRCNACRTETNHRSETSPHFVRPNAFI